jgi:hypothetical protein
MKLFGNCGCKVPDLYRIERSPWLRRWLPYSRRYRCRNCDRNVLRLFDFSDSGGAETTLSPVSLSADTDHKRR